MGPPGAAGLVAALLAQRRSWAPPLWVALAVGAALRVVVMLLAAADTAQPYDFAHDFPDAADAVRAGLEPTTHLRYGGWHYLPFLAYVLAGQRELGEALGLSWNVAGRVVPVLADLALIPLIAKLAGDRGRLRALQYACLPLAVLVSADHGQFPPIVLLFAVAALVCARGGRAHLAGLLIGLSVTGGTWSALLVPGVVLTLSGVRHRVTVLAWLVAVPAICLASSAVFLDTAWSGLVGLAKAIMSTRPVVGDWGWTAVVTGGAERVDPALGHIGTPILLAALLAAAWWWRRSDPVALTVALLLVFLIVTYRLGAQYLLWPVPYLLIRPTRGTWPALVVACLWAAAGYWRIFQPLGVSWPDFHHDWALSSLVVICFLLAALPARSAAPEPVARPAEVS
jgi:hypothetical protein